MLKRQVSLQRSAGNIKTSYSLCPKKNVILGILEQIIKEVK
jgi:hypothetical protein